jgi:hypothetical protein
MVVTVRSRAGRTKAITGVVVVLLAFGTLLAVPAGAVKHATATKCSDPSGTVKVGLSYFGGVEQNVGDLGAGDIASLSPGTQAIINGYRAGIAALNDAGGLAGCQVEPVIFNFSAASPDFNQESQQECAAFTQDNKVIAVFATAYETKVGVDCFAKAKTPMFQMAGSYVPTCDDMKKYAGYIYLPDGVAGCNTASFVGIWKKAGLFPADAKVGILVFDDGTGQGKTIADKVWTPELKKLKIPVETFSFPGATSESTFANTNTALGAGLLKFKSDGVNVILFTPSAGQASAAFLPQAASQGYFPNYGFNTADGLTIATSVGATAIKTGIAISWGIADLPVTAQQALPTNPAITACAKWSMPNPLGLTGSSTYCDFLSILQAGFANQTKANAASLKKGIDALGTSWKSSVTYGGASRFKKNHYDGVSMIQVLKFNPDAKAWEYLKPNQKAQPIG